MWNNPLKYTDPDGEIVDLILFIGGAALLKGYWNATHPSNHGKWNWKAFAVGMYEGATMAYSLYASMGLTMFSNYFPSYQFNIGPAQISLGVGLIFGTNGFGLGFFAGINYLWDLGDDYFVNIGLEGGLNAFGRTPGTNASSTEGRFGYGVEFGHSEFEIGLYSTSFRANNGTSQRVGGATLRLGYFRARYENDGAPFSDWFGRAMVNENSDKYRTAAFQVSYKQYTIGGLLFTGDPAKGSEPWDVKGPNGIMVDGINYPRGFYSDFTQADDYRLGALYFGSGSNRVGVNSEWVRHFGQNIIAHGLIKPQPYFLMQDKRVRPYHSYQRSNRYTLW